MGISTNLDALLSVTDHDIIEKSNLNRRFLFREKDIIENKSKAECAVNSIKKINSKINSQYNVELVSDDIENIFKEKFFKKQNAIVLAVDNF
jgi:molybdopterin/thiamine biosynthesis adenylyltransferase